jgi:pimeloyl-ACP methyl ester carboxylesterase
VLSKNAGFAEVNGTRLYYESQGTGFPILFLHGFTLDHRMWSRQVDALSSEFRVVTYDARGFGRSALPGEGSYRHCDDAAALCAYLQIERAVVVGHSVGGHQMLELALTRPSIVAGLVALCLSGLASVPFPDELTQLFVTLRQTARESGIEAAKRIWSRAGWFASAREVPALASELAVMLDDYSGWHWTHDNPAKGITPPAAEQLQALRAPARVITGVRDLPYNTDIGEALIRGIPNATRVRLDTAGHMASMEAPDAVNQAIAELARRVAESER